MEFDPGIHTVMRSVLSLKTRCDNTVRDQDGWEPIKKICTRDEDRWEPVKKTCTHSGYKQIANEYY
jgi:hypothetical protein